MSTAHANLARYWTIHVLGAAFPLTAGVVLYGWRGAGSVATVVLFAMFALFIWRRIGRRGGVLHMGQGIYLAVLLGMMLPAHLLHTGRGDGLAGVANPWAILAAGGVCLAIILWLLGGLGHGPIHPVIISFLLMVVLFGDALSAHVVLHREAVLVGNVMSHAPRQPHDQAWIDWREMPKADAIFHRKSAADELTSYTRGMLAPHKWMSIDGLLREAMPPLEDLVIGGHPGPIGLSCAIATLVGGLFLVYRGVIDFRIPLLTILAAYLALILLPVPVALSGSSVTWRPLFLPRAQLDWAVMLTFANYQLLASPILFVAFFLATSTCVAPMHRRAKAVFAVLLGVLCAAAQVYFSCTVGPYVALLIVGFFSPWLDERLGRWRGV